ncbi:MAG: hypothetical protein AAFR59_11670 [Bacteroidota bacterium]
MKLQDLKLSYVKQFSQIVTFSHEGTFVDSCNSLVETHTWHGTSLYERFPILTSLQEAIKIMDQGPKPICLPAIEMSIEGRPGVFDFEIYVHPQDANLRVWMIYDNTSFYRYLQEIQQERNVLRMEKEDLMGQKDINRR